MREEALIACDIGPGLQKGSAITVAQVIHFSCQSQD